MDVFACPACGGRVFFRNPGCGACGAAFAYDPDARGFAQGARACANRDAIGCNWIADGAGALCRSCAMTRTVPDLAVADNAALWAEAEEAKRHVLANLMRWGLFGPADRFAAPVFDMLGEATATGAAQVTMGHADGVVTLNVAEADPAIREARRRELAERHRTMIGHIRHELGHLVFDRLAQAEGFLDAFRALFGDERADYDAALRRHYDDGPTPEDAAPPERHLTDYAAVHPHEDWAETFAHYLHLVDVTDAAARIGLTTPALAAAGGAAFEPYAGPEAETLLGVAADLTIALNHVNRAMGLSDVYPFVLTPATRGKLAFVHDWIARAA